MKVYKIRCIFADYMPKKLNNYRSSSTNMVMNRLLSQLALVVTFANELGGDAYVVAQDQTIEGHEVKRGQMIKLDAVHASRPPSVQRQHERGGTSSQGQVARSFHPRRQSSNTQLESFN